MPTIVDALILTLGIDPTQFVKGQRQTVESLKQTKEGFKKHGEEVEKATKGIMSDITKLGLAFGGLFATIRGSQDITKFLKSLAKTDQALGLTSKNINMAKEKIFQLFGHPIKNSRLFRLRFLFSNANRT